MRIEMDEGKVVCTLENRNNWFLNHECWDLFEPYQSGKLRLRKKDDENTYIDLSHIIESAKYDGVEVDEKVVEYFSEVEQKVMEIRRERREQARKKELEKLREQFITDLRENGCKNCQYLKYDIDQPICRVTRESLPRENKPTYGRDGIYYLFYWVTMPSENCPYKAERRAE